LEFSASYFHEYLGGYWFKALEKLSNNEQFYYSGYYASDLPWVFGVTTGVYPIVDGFWIVDDTFGYAFVSSNDSITIFENFYDNPFQIVHIAGEINNKHLIYFWDFDNIGFVPYLIDLSDSPIIDSSHVTPIKYDETKTFHKIEQFDANKYLISDWGILSIYSFDHDSLIFQEVTLNNFYFDKWVYRSPFLYAHHYSRLYKYTFDEVSLNFVKKDTLLISDKQISVDQNLRYAVYINMDTLILYNIDSIKITRKWDISLLNNPKRPIVSYPDIFIHQTTSVTNIEESELQKSAEISIQTYPNPFNSSTKIKFTLPKPETVKIEVYNIIGQKIQTLLNKPMPAGYHEVEFNGQNLSSGVYLYRIQAGVWQDVRKMVLVK